MPINNIRKVTARRLTESQAVPHFFLTNVVDAQKLIAFRKDVNESLAASGGKVSINDLIVRAVAVALRAHPEVNSSWGGDKLLRHNRINIGIAVALPDGLIVPVVQDADRKSLGEIAQTTVALAEKARAGKLKLDEMSGGTFTISNLGMFGIDEFTAVINPPEAAILAVGAGDPGAGGSGRAARRGAEDEDHHHRRPPGARRGDGGGVPARPEGHPRGSA